jgi:hypothetical protein
MNRCGGHGAQGRECVHDDLEIENERQQKSWLEKSQNQKAAKMITVGNSQLDRSAKFLYHHSVFWPLVQFLFGAIPAIYILRNEVRNLLTVVIPALTVSPTMPQIAIYVVGFLAIGIQLTALLMLILFPLFSRPSLSRFRNQVYIVTVFSLIPHSWNLNSRLFQSPFQVPILSYIFFALPCFIVALHLHKAASEKQTEVPA